MDIEQYTPPDLSLSHHTFVWKSYSVKLKPNIFSDPRIVETSIICYLTNCQFYPQFATVRIMTQHFNQLLQNNNVIPTLSFYSVCTTRQLIDWQKESLNGGRNDKWSPAHYFLVQFSKTRDETVKHQKYPFTVSLSTWIPPPSFTNITNCPSGFPLFWTDKIPWLFPDFSSIFFHFPVLF